MNRLLSEVHRTEMLFVGHVYRGSRLRMTKRSAASMATQDSQRSSARKRGHGIGCWTICWPNSKPGGDESKFRLTVLSGIGRAFAGRARGGVPQRTLKSDADTWRKRPAETVNRKGAANLVELARISRPLMTE